MFEQSAAAPSPAMTAAPAGWDSALTEFVRYLRAREARERKDVVWNSIKRWFITLVFGGGFLFYLVFYMKLLGVDAGPVVQAVALIPIKGEISAESDASAKAVIPLIDKACASDAVEHIILHINSPGGAPNESERIVSAIEACQQTKNKKFTALIDGTGASAAYMIAIHADEIVAGRYSIVGSVGAIMRYVDASAAATKLGLKEQIYRSGILKGGPSPLSPAEEGMDKVNQEMVVKLGADFLEEVYAQREGKVKAKRDQVFTGRIWTSPEAKEMGLIDRVGTLEDLMRVDFKSLKLHEYAVKTPFAKGLGFSLSQMVHETLFEIETPQIR